MVKELIVKNDPKSPISEIFRTLRTNIQFMNNKNKLKSLLITSTLSGEGKSWISANLAVTFAQMGKRVILLDADMRKGRQYRIFNISPRPGLSNYLSGVTDDEKTIDLADYVQETEVENLYVIPAGNVPPNPSELLVSESMINLLDKLKEICDIVIVDGPPTQLITDSLILSRITDSTAIVAESNKTKKESLRRIIDNIQKVGGKVAGVILNKVQLSAKKYDQSYYYGSTHISKKSKKSLAEAISNKTEDNWERKNRNTQRARQLVNQNKEKEISINENDDNTAIEENEKIQSFEKTENTKVSENKQNYEIDKSNLGIYNNGFNNEQNDISVANNNLRDEQNNMDTTYNGLNHEQSNFGVTNTEFASTQNNMDVFNYESISENNNINTEEKNENNQSSDYMRNNDYGRNNNYDNINVLDVKTQDILRQVNEYIENERKKLY